MKIKPQVSFTVNIDLSEGELRALDALAGYGTKEFLTCFYTHMGKHYLEPFEKDLIGLFEKAKSLRPQINEIQEARKKLGLPIVNP